MELRSPSSRRLSRSTWVRVVWLFGPLVLVTAVLRLLTYGFLVHGEVAPAALWPQILWPLVPPLMAVAVVAGGRRAGYAPFGLGVAAAALLLGAGWVLGALGPPSAADWLTWRTVEALRWDLALILLLAVMSAIALERTGGRLHAAVVTVLHLLVPLLLLIPGVTFGVFLATGTSADGPLLYHFITHAGDLTEVVASEVHALTVGLLLLPVAASLTPWLLLRAPRMRRWLGRGAAVGPAAARYVLLLTLPMLVLLMAAPRASVPPSHRASSVVGLAESAWRGLFPETPTFTATPAFEARSLRLEGTDALRQRSVVLIVMESVRARSVTPYAPSLGTTPFLDRLAQEGLLVEDLFVVTPYTNKALSALLTGAYPYPHRALRTNGEAPLPSPGLPNLLAPHGYRSAFFTPADLGFEEQDRLARNLGFETIRGDGAYPTEGFEEANYFGYEDRIMLQPSLDWVEARQAADEPFLLTYLTLSAHHPYNVPSDAPRRDWTGQPDLDDYLDAVRYTDRFLQAVFEAFDARGLLDETIFIITSDHGEAFGEHRQRLHGEVLWDEALKVPGLIVAPGLVPGGERVQGARQHIDLVPTVADLLGLRLAGGSLPGRSWLDEAQPGRALVHSSWDSDDGMALRRDSLKYLYRPGYPMQVFDWHDDPMERDDLAPLLPEAHLRGQQRAMHRWRAAAEALYEAPR